MVFEIPKNVNVYDLIAVAVIEQAIQDAQSNNSLLAAEASNWLDGEGRNWWEMLGFERTLFTKLRSTERIAE